MINPPQVRPEEPTAVTPHGGICGGKSQQWLRYPTKPHAGICGGGAGYPAPLPDKSSLERPFSRSTIALRIMGRPRQRRVESTTTPDEPSTPEICDRPRYAAGSA